VVRRDWLQLTGPWNCAATRAKGWQLLAHWGRAGGRVGEHTDVGQIAENLVYKFYNLPNWSKLIQIVPFVQHSGSRLIGHWMFQFPIHCFLHSSASLCMFVEEGSDPELNFGDTCSSYIDGLASPLILQCLYQKNAAQRTMFSYCSFARQARSCWELRQSRHRCQDREPNGTPVMI